MISFESGPMYSVNNCFLSASSEENALPANRSSFTPTSTTSLYYSESSFHSEMSHQYFSAVTKEEIRKKCHSRCIVCMKVLVNLGQCAHILDAAEEGTKMATFAINAGVLEPTYSRSAVANGVLLCAGCHQDFLTQNILILSPPRQVLQFLVDYMRTDNTIPIYQILDKLRTGSAPHVNVPDPTPILPYLDLFSLVSLAPEKLEGVQMSIHDEEKVSQLLDGRWSVVPSLTAPSSPTTARIHDATALPRSFYGPSGVHVLSAKGTLSPHYWRLPARITPILAYLLHHVAHPNPFNESEEVRLAIQLRALLMLRYAESKGPLGGLGYGSGNLGSPVEGGGNLSGKGKWGRKKKDSGTHPTVNSSASLSPIVSAVSSIREQTLQVRFSEHHHFRAHDNPTPICTQLDRLRTPITSVNHRFLSRLPHPHFHRTQSIRVTPIIQMIRHLQHRLMRSV